MTKHTHPEIESKLDIIEYETKENSKQLEHINKNCLPTLTQGIENVKGSLKILMPVVYAILAISVLAGIAALIEGLFI